MLEKKKTETKMKSTLDGHISVLKIAKERSELDERSIEISPAEMWKENAKNKTGHQSTVWQFKQV